MTTAPTPGQAIPTARERAIGGLEVGGELPDFELLDHAGNRRRLSALVGGDPTVVQFFRGWWCPKEQAFFRRLLVLQDDAEVAYSRIVSISVDPPEVNAALRAGLGPAGHSLGPGARRPVSAGSSRDDRHPSSSVRARGVRDGPELRIHSAYNGYWYWGRPTHGELVHDLRELTGRFAPTGTPEP